MAPVPDTVFHWHLVLVLRDFALAQRVRGAAAVCGVARQHALVDEVVDVAQGHVGGYLANFRPLSRRELSLEVAGEHREENVDYSLQNMR